MYKYLLFIGLLALVSCGKLDKTPIPPPVEKGTRPPLEEWLKQRNFTDNFYIDSLGIRVFYRLVETEDNYMVFADFQSDTVFVKNKVREITRKTGLKEEDLGLYISFKTPPFTSFPASTTAIPVDVFLQSRPLLTARKMMLIEGNGDFLTTSYNFGKGYIVRHTISPNRTKMKELKNSGAITAKNEGDYVFTEFVATAFGENGLRPKHFYDPF